MIPLPEASPQPTIVFDFVVVMGTEPEMYAVVDPVITVNVGRSETPTLPLVDAIVLDCLRVIVVLDITMIE